VVTCPAPQALVSDLIVQHADPDADAKAIIKWLHGRYVTRRLSRPVRPTGSS
jgi:hypothetical protein